MGCFWMVLDVSVWGMEPPEESLAGSECGVGHGLGSHIGAVGAGRICGSSKGRWNPDKTGISDQEAVWVGVALCWHISVTCRQYWNLLSIIALGQWCRGTKHFRLCVGT